jgi:hypothetical protein
VLNSGKIRRIDPDDIAEMFMITTHYMPLNYQVDQLLEMWGGGFPRGAAGCCGVLLTDDGEGEGGRSKGFMKAWWKVIGL